MLVGLVAPLMQTAMASPYTLTILNPAGINVPQQQLPMASRQPIIEKLEAGGAQGPVKILILNYDKNQDQLQLWALSKLIKDELEALFPGTTVELVPVEHMGGPLTFDVMPSTWQWFNTDLWPVTDSTPYGKVPRLGSPWGPKNIYGHVDGMPLSEPPFARYQKWASIADFVLFGEQN